MNPVGGMEIYSKEYFLKDGVHLSFQNPKILPYQQLNNEFVPGLSIIDVLMFNSKETVVDHHLNSYTLL